MKKLTKEERWHAARIGHITSSCLGKLTTTGRGKNGAKYGDTALTYLYEKMYERETGEEVVSRDNYNFRFGRENEPYAVEWLRANTMYTVEHCSVDLPKIAFVKPWRGVKFGDSPDFRLKDGSGEYYAVGEIKSIESKAKFQAAKKWTKVEAIEEYKEQLAGHFLAHPRVGKLVYMMYDGITDDDSSRRSPTDASRGIVFWYTREDFGEEYLEAMKARIIEADMGVDEAIKSGKRLSEVLNN